MTALLILLGMFSLTLMVSNLGFLRKANAFSYISIPLLIGLAFSPEGLVPLLPSTRGELSWAVKVGLTWITFLAGTRLSELTPSWEQTKKLFPILLGYIAFLVSTLALFDYFQVGDTANERLAIALFLSAALFSSKENPFLLSILFLSLIYLLKRPSMDFGPMDLVYPLGVGLLMGVVCRLIISPKGGLDTPARLTLVGLCALGTGWAIGLGTLEVLVGLSFGWAMAFVHKYGICKDPKLKATEYPLRFVVALFAGLYLQLDQWVIFIGLSLALLRIGVKWCVLNIGVRKASRDEILTQVVPISHLALPITLSLHLSVFSSGVTSFILSVFCVGFIANDFAALFFELLKKNPGKEEAVVERT